MTTQPIPSAPAVAAFQVAPQPVVTYSPSGYYRSPLFWVCNCPDACIHPVEDGMCPVCGYSRAGAPEARLSEVIRYVNTPGTPYTPSVGLLRELTHAVADEVGIPF